MLCCVSVHDAVCKYRILRQSCSIGKIISTLFYLAVWCITEIRTDLTDQIIYQANIYNLIISCFPCKHSAVSKNILIRVTFVQCAFAFESFISVHFDPFCVQIGNITATFQRIAYTFTYLYCPDEPVERISRV